MNKFVNTLKTNNAARPLPVTKPRVSRSRTPVVTSRTENGAVTYASSGRAIVDLFFKIGASRGTDISLLFKTAYQENQDLAIRVLLWARDARGGAGERQQFKSLLTNLIVYGTAADRNVAIRVINKIPELGRWDDMFDLLFLDPIVDNAIVRLVRDGLTSGNGLLAKWLPRDSSRNKRNKDVARFLASRLGMSPRIYRKLIVQMTKVVETPMAAKDYSEINYSHVPGTATARYRKAFTRNDPIRWGEFTGKLKKGTVKSNISSGATMPHDLIRMWKAGGYGSNADLDVLWDQLPALPFSSVIPLVDTSSSMNQTVSGSIEAMDIAVGLGLYIADKATGPFNGVFLNFNDDSHMCHLSGSTITEKIRSMSNAPWGGSTNLLSAARAIVAHAKKHRVADSDMPARVLVISDMEFNSNNNSYRSGGFTSNAFRSIFESAGYSAPVIVWWNVANRNTNNVPDRANEDGTMLISGYSVAVAKTALAGRYVDPITTVMDAVVKERYNW